MKHNITDEASEKYASCLSPHDCIELEAELDGLEKDRPEHTNHPSEFKIANINEACREKITEFEHELNKQGYWNIALVAYQKDC